ncbi:MAG: SurA N-terminal domain-containing protein, partial [Rhizobiales bacterium]|nr:SurA N-terminal domain-containing protein [Hyphomicrobiales bacterium]
ALSGIHVNTVAQVGNTDITVVDFDRAYRSEIENLSRRFGQRLSPDQARALGIPQQVLGQLITQASLDDQASSLSLGVSQDMLIKEIAEDPAFRGPDGNFSRTLFLEQLRQLGISEDDYVLQRQAAEKRRQLAIALSGGPTIPQALAKALHEYQTEARTISYIVLPSSVIPDVGEPNADELAAYFNDHKAEWRAPEYRDISYVELDPDMIADPATISDADAMKAYEADKARFTS